MIDNVELVRCHCGKRVLKIRIKDEWFTMCNMCYRNSFPDMEKMHGFIKVMTDAHLRYILDRLEPVLESQELIGKFVNAIKVERVCRKL